MKNRSTQSDRNMNFDGMESMAPSRSTRFAHNMWSGHSNDGRLVQKAQAPNRTGNDGSCVMPKNLGASVTKDTDRKPMTSPMPKLPAQGSVRDNINRGSQYRGAGGVMPKQPANPDQIRIGQTGGPGYGNTSRGKRPPTDAGRNTFNFGPRSQY